MARVRPLHTYPSEFWDIVRACATEGKEFSQRMDHIRKALSLQGKFYAFRQALGREALEGNRQAEYLQYAMDTICWVDKTGSEDGSAIVSFCNKSHHPDAAVLRGFLENAKDVPLPTEAAIESAFEKMIRLQAEAEAGKDPTGGKYG